jgi:hypothetical protein
MIVGAEDGEAVIEKDGTAEGVKVEGVAVGDFVIG